MCHSSDEVVLQGCNVCLFLALVRLFLSVLSGCLLYSVTCWFVGRSVGLSAHNIVLLLPGGLMIAKGYEMQLRWDH